MIVLDTNVLSEPLKTQPDTVVLAWMATHYDACTTAVSVGELLTGARRLPYGRRRDGLLGSIEQIARTFAERLLPYDEEAARVYAQMQESRCHCGLPLSVEDGMIAAICFSRRATLATRNVKDFQQLGVELLNPWSAGAQGRSAALC